MVASNTYTPIYLGVEEGGSSSAVNGNEIYLTFSQLFVWRSPCGLMNLFVREDGTPDNQALSRSLQGALYSRLYL